jgi:hypothetical protein
VLKPESIPLPQSELESYSSAASGMPANQPATISDRPTTATLGTADPNPTSSTGVEEPGAEGGTTASAGMGTATDGGGTSAGTQSGNGTGTSNGSGTSKQPSIATATGTGSPSPSSTAKGDAAGFDENYVREFCLLPSGYWFSSS